MCIITVLRRVGDRKTMLTDYNELDTSICLLGKYCTAIGHSQTIYQDPEWEEETCAACDEDDLMTIVHWSLSVSEPKHKEPLVNQKCPPPSSAIDKYNSTVLAELHKFLDKDTDFDECKLVLHYILGLPHYIDKLPLIDAFANSVGRWCGFKRGEDLRRLSLWHGFGREMQLALQLAYQHPKDKRT